MKIAPGMPELLVGTERLELLAFERAVDTKAFPGPKRIGSRVEETLEIELAVCRLETERFSIDNAAPNMKIQIIR
jgi:hypothetical protein